MKLVVVSSAPFIYKNGKAYAYGPYITEMALWAKYCENISFCCPVWDDQNGLLVTEIPFSVHKHYRLADFNVKSAIGIYKAVFSSLYNFMVLLRAMATADHIHLRCPGNIGLLGCIAQLFFPFKVKTAKYAGNWDFKAKAPFSYVLQKKILTSRFTRNMQVLVYGQWPGRNRNIKPFFTATYSVNDKHPFKKAAFSDGISFVFAGMLVEGKNPLYAIKIVEYLYQKGFHVRLSLFGEGPERGILQDYITSRRLQDFVFLKGNQSGDVLKSAYRQSHFVLLPSNSEGWPKVIAEGMFWGAVPLVTPVSSVPYMLDYGNRGLLLTMDMEKDVPTIIEFLENQGRFSLFSESARVWSQEYTVEKFESEIKKLLV